jgi:glycosyltransferase involved in cell wall biosynthesis
LVIVVKYYHPLDRLSGIIGYLTPLAKYLARHYDLHIVTYRQRQPLETPFRRDGYTVHRVFPFFPSAAAIKVRELAPSIVLVVSGMHSYSLATVYFLAFNLLAPRGPKMFFYQASNPSQTPPKLLGLVLDRYTRVFCLNPMNFTALQSKFPEKPLLLPPGIDVELLQGVKPAEKRTRIRVGFINAFSKVKGADIALRVFSEVSVPDVEFVAAGVGELEAELVSRYGNQERISFYGFLNESDRFSLMKSCDIVVLPFRTEVSVLGISQTVLECMAMGVVVLGSNTASITPAIEPGVDGFIFSSEDQLVSQLTTLCEQPALMKRISAAASRKACSEFNIERTVAKLTRHFSEET